MEPHDKEKTREVRRGVCALGAGSERGTEGGTLVTRSVALAVACLLALSMTVPCKAATPLIYSKSCTVDFL